MNDNKILATILQVNLEKVNNLDTAASLSTGSDGLGKRTVLFLKNPPSAISAVPESAVSLWYRRSSRKTLKGKTC